MHPYRLRSRLTAALAAIFLGTDAAAVQVNADGHGQVLLFPYYTVRSTPAGESYATLLSIANTTNRAKALRIRFLEGKAGVGGLNFNLFLAAYDVWTAATVPVGAGGGIYSTDNSCTSPAVGSTLQTAVPFRNVRYATDPLGSSLDRTREGHIEVIEMGTIAPGSPLEIAITPVPGAGNISKPPACGGVPTTNDVPADLQKPRGGLVGSASIINVTAGTDFSTDALALSQWSDKVQWTAPGEVQPTLGSASPPVSYVVDRKADDDIAYITTWPNGRDAVSAVLMVSAVTADFSIEPAIGAATDWVITMPTKRQHVTVDSAAAPFQTVLSATGACEPAGDDSQAIMPTTYDRDGQRYAPIPTQSLPPSGSLCFTSNVVTFGIGGDATASDPFQSAHFRQVALATPWVNGFARLGLFDPESPTIHALAAPAGMTTVINTRTGSVTTGANVTYFGLPVIGFASQSYTNGSVEVGGRPHLSNYGGVFPFKYERRINVSQ